MFAEDPVIQLLRATLSEEVLELTRTYLEWLTVGDYKAILSCDEARGLFTFDLPAQSSCETFSDANEWLDRLFSRLNQNLSPEPDAGRSVVYFCIGYAALLAFMQANVTGPPLPFRSEDCLFSQRSKSPADQVELWRVSLVDSLKRDGIAAYSLITNLELLCVAETILASPKLLKNIVPTRWLKTRAAFIHQRLLSEPSSSIELLIFEDLALAEQEMRHVTTQETFSAAEVCLELEIAMVQLYYGHDKRARQTLARATEKRSFEYKLTGRLGKRTKYQQHDISQLVVLAKSTKQEGHVDEDAKQDAKLRSGQSSVQPKDIELNDDTLLEHIRFNSADVGTASYNDPENEHLPAGLRDLDPSDQPMLDALDSIILLTYASSITNTSPEYGLTREEMLPYAARVLAGGSSNWQVYTQALLVRSRIEGFSSRTVERGLLQLQALVDQVAVESNTVTSDEPVTAFLPAAKADESASAAQRLQYVFQLASPMRWELEAELASRWVQLGGLRTALDIYERLHMWAEAALCLAATEQEDKARNLVKRQLFEPDESKDIGDATRFDGPAITPPPSDAPRLYCILGDMDQSIAWYEAAWAVSNKRYARAQRSIGRIHISKRQFSEAVDAYSKSLKANQLNQQSWFALGCALMELVQYDRAVEAFSRCVQLDDSDAESWSNLGASLLKIDTNLNAVEEMSTDRPPAEDEDASSVNPRSAVSARQKNLVNALKAFQRASTIKHDSYRIWYNILVTAASVTPSDYATVLTAQRRIIQLRGSSDGEGCIDVEILEHLVDYVVKTTPRYDPEQPGLARMTVKFIDEAVVPLISTSTRLWHLMSRFSLWRARPGSALDAEEKAWRAATAQPGWEIDNRTAWSAVVEATIRLCDAYESLGPQERTEGLAAGSGQPVAKDWKYKARSALKAVLSKARDSWEGSPGWDRLKDAQQSLIA